VLDMPRIFEDFVTCALRDALQPLRPGSAVIGQFATWLDEDELVALRPDVVWLDQQEQPLAVLDAKYKAEKPAGFPNADIYQALAYATTLGLGEVHLVYAKGNEPVQTYTARGVDVRIHAHALNLAENPEAILDQVRALAVGVLHRVSNA
jgi:5-methylcytosine-specific restriction enzyme subunit McrC